MWKLKKTYNIYFSDTMSSHTFHELEKWHKSIIHRYGYIVMPHMSHKITSYCEELDFFIEKAKEKMTVTLDSSRKSDIRIMMDHIQHLQKHAESMCKKPASSKSSESEEDSSDESEETVSLNSISSIKSTESASILDRIKSATSNIFGSSEEKESTESMNSTESSNSEMESRPKRAMSQYNIFVKDRYDDLKEEYPEKSTPELMKMISKEWKEKKGTTNGGDEPESSDSGEESGYESGSESESDEQSNESGSDTDMEEENENKSDEDIENKLDESEESEESEESNKQKTSEDGQQGGKSESVNAWKQKLSKYYGL